jgi:FixJ family two-component response regulator
MYKIVVIEDNYADFFIFNEYAKESFEALTLVHLESLSAFENYVRQNTIQDVSIIFLDLNLPSHHGVSLIKEVMKLANSIPVIVLSGNSDVKLTTTSMALGIKDYLLKDQLNPILIHNTITNTIEQNNSNKLTHTR